MIGDKLVLKPTHRKAARQIFEGIFPTIEHYPGRYIITIAGESGSGKSETAEALADEFCEKNMGCVILQQDDYFVYPPKTNDRRRRADIRWVGLQEVRLDLLDLHLNEAIAGATELVKPVVIYQEDRITQQSMSLEDVKVVIAEGTYTTILENANTRVFIDLTYEETKRSRLERAREEQDEFLERVLKIEHKIISAHKDKSDIIITPDFEVVIMNQSRKSK